MKLIHFELTFYFILFIYLLYTNLRYAVYFSMFMIGMSLFSFFCTSQGMDLDLETFNESEVVYQEHTGDYQKMYDKLSEFHKIKKMFKLNEHYLPFGIFYDNPEKLDNVKKCRSVYGIIKEKSKEKCPKHKEMLEHLYKNGFKTGALPKTECLKGIYSSWFSVQNSFIFIAKVIVQFVNQKFFSRLFTPKWKINKVKIARKNYCKKHGVVEIFRPYEINLLIPVENEKDFIF
jgi:hypothetical protein